MTCQPLPAARGKAGGQVTKTHLGNPITKWAPALGKYRYSIKWSSPPGTVDCYCHGAPGRPSTWGALPDLSGNARCDQVQNRHCGEEPGTVSWGEEFIPLSFSVRALTDFPFSASECSVSKEPGARALPSELGLPYRLPAKGHRTQKAGSCNSLLQSRARTTWRSQCSCW